MDDVKESRVRYIKKRTDGAAERIQKKREIDIQSECSEGDRSSGLGQGIMVLLHF